MENTYRVSDTKLFGFVDNGNNIFTYFTNRSITPQTQTQISLHI
jgi:hypothetical protein